MGNIDWRATYECALIVGGAAVGLMIVIRSLKRHVDRKEAVALEKRKKDYAESVKQRINKLKLEGLEVGKKCWKIQQFGGKNIEGQVIDVVQGR
jgi:hypothetical protein